MNDKKYYISTNDALAYMNERPASSERTQEVQSFEQRRANLSNERLSCFGHKGCSNLFKRFGVRLD